MTDQKQTVQVTGEIKPEKLNRLYIRWQLTDDSLKALFAPHGNVTDARVAFRAANFGFVTFETEEEAAAALKALNGQQIKTDAVTVEHADTNKKPRQRKNRRQPGDKNEGATQDGQQDNANGTQQNDNNNRPSRGGRGRARRRRPRRNDRNATQTDGQPKTDNRPLPAQQQ